MLVLLNININQPRERILKLIYHNAKEVLTKNIENCIDNVKIEVKALNNQIIYYLLIINTYS